MNEYTSAGSGVGSKNDAAVVGNADDSGSHGMGSVEIEVLIHYSDLIHRGTERKTWRWRRKRVKWI